MGVVTSCWLIMDVKQSRIAQEFELMWGLHVIHVLWVHIEVPY